MARRVRAVHLRGKDQRQPADSSAEHQDNEDASGQQPQMGRDAQRKTHSPDG